MWNIFKEAMHYKVDTQPILGSTQQAGLDGFGQLDRSGASEPSGNVGLFFFCLCQNTINKVIEPKENSIRIQTQIILL